MKNLFKGFVIASMAITASFAQAADSSDTMTKLLQKIKSERVSEARIDKKREAEFRSARADKQALLTRAKAQRTAEKARGQRLLEQHADNERRMAQLAADLVAAQGDLKEAFGVVRGVAGDATGIIAASVISAQFPGRAEELAAIGALKGLPGLEQLENLWFALQTELTVSRGALLNLLTGQATLVEKYHQGEIVGYIITAVLFLGLLLAVERVFTLGRISAKIKTQLKTPTKPGNNPLGRILEVYHSAKGTDVETLELKLDEAILKEIPRLERGISIIKVLAAIAPMLGLLGTVTGMIGTFQAITLFGTGDPKMMAGGISTALVTTVLGLVAALPLMLVHAVVSGRSKSLLHVLEEQSVGMIAEHAEKESK